VLRDLDGLEVNRIYQLVVEPTLQATGDPDILAFGDCAACPQPGKENPVPPAGRRHTRKLPIWPAKSSAGCAARRCCRSHTEISARWFRSADGARSEA
jgi:hypothetical protein